MRVLGVLLLMLWGSSAYAQQDERPLDVKSFSLRVSSPTRVASRLRVHPRVDGVVPNGRTFSMDVRVQGPGVDLTFPHTYQISEWACYGCDPYPGAPPDVCDNPCEWRSKSTSIEIPAATFRKPGTYTVTVTGKGFGTATATVEVLDHLAMRQRKEAERRAREESLRPKGNIAWSKLVRSCDSVTTKRKPVDFAQLPAAKLEGWRGPQNTRNARVVEGALVFMRSDGHTIFVTRSEQETPIALTGEGERVVEWEWVDGGVAYAVSPERSNVREYSWVKLDGTGRRAMEASEYPSKRARDSEMAAKGFQSRDTWEIDENYVFGAAIRSGSSIAFVYDRRTDVAHFPPKSLDVGGYGAAGRDSIGIVFPGRTGKSSQRYAYFLNPRTGFALCLAPDQLYRASFHIMALSGDYAMLRLGPGKDATIAIADIRRGVVTIIGTLDYDSRIIALNGGEFLVTTVVRRQVHTFVVKGDTASVKRLAKPITTRYRGGGNIDVSPDAKTILIGEHVISR